MICCLRLETNWTLATWFLRGNCFLWWTKTYCSRLCRSHILLLENLCRVIYPSVIKSIYVVDYKSKEIKINNTHNTLDCSFFYLVFDQIFFHEFIILSYSNWREILTWKQLVFGYFEKLCQSPVCWKTVKNNQIMFYDSSVI